MSTYNDDSGVQSTRNNQLKSDTNTPKFIEKFQSPQMKANESSELAKNCKSTIVCGG